MVLRLPPAVSDKNLTLCYLPQIAIQIIAATKATFLTDMTLSQDGPVERIHPGGQAG